MAPRSPAAMPRAGTSIAPGPPRSGAKPAKPANSTQKKVLHSLWNDGTADANNMLSGLSSLLDSDMAPLDNPAHEFWSATLSDVMQDPILSHGLPVTKPKP